VRRRFPQLPILCVSIDGPSDDSRQLETAGHLMKPFRRSQLERAIESALIPTAVGARVARTA
jgi:two-component SAPR family response regulator